jgi:hypothetical protein
MYVRIVTFSLNGPTDEQYRNQATAIADLFNAWPGLQVKLWLADEDANRYGGIYLFANQTAAHESRSTPLFAAMVADFNFADLTVDEFEIIDAPSEITALRVLQASAAVA